MPRAEADIGELRAQFDGWDPMYVLDGAGPSLSMQANKVQTSNAYCKCQEVRQVEDPNNGRIANLGQGKSKHVDLLGACLTAR